MVGCSADGHGTGENCAARGACRHYPGRSGIATIRGCFAPRHPMQDKSNGRLLDVDIPAFTVAVPSGEGETLIKIS